MHIYDNLRKLVKDIPLEVQILMRLTTSGHIMATWRIEYINLKKFEKKGKSRKDSDLLPLFFPEECNKTVMGEVLFLSPEERNILISMTEVDTKKNLKEQTLLCFPRLAILAHIPLI